MWMEDRCFLRRQYLQFSEKGKSGNFKRRKADVISQMNKAEWKVYGCLIVALLLFTFFLQRRLSLSHYIARVSGLIKLHKYSKLFRLFFRQTNFLAFLV